MGLEDTNTIDMSVKGPAGELLFLIIDAGLTASDTERLSLLQKKLAAYALHIVSPEFVAQNSGNKYESIVFRVICQSSPTSGMREIQSVTIPNHGYIIPVQFEVIS